MLRRIKIYAYLKKPVTILLPSNVTILLVLPGYSQHKATIHGLDVNSVVMIVHGE